MTDFRISPTRLKGWGRLGLPAATTIMAATPMLWAVGLFDATAEPLQHALIFGLAGMLLCGLTPFLYGWALQGFLVRRKPAEDSEPQEHHGGAPRGPAAAIGRARAS